MQSGVSVCMTTYNQENYIAEAIESVLSQKTTFPVQLVIGDDCSKDGTCFVCRGYTSKLTNIILLDHKANMGLPRNLSLVWQECKGQYIAMLEGDDLWSSPDKLQTQVELMEQHPEYSMCFTRTTIRDEDNPNNHHRQFPYRELTKPTLTISDMIEHNLIANCSVMYRAGLVPQLPYWMLTLPYCDLALHCLHLEHGVAGYIPEFMAIYRMHGGSAFESKSLAERVRISTEVYFALSRHLKKPSCCNQASETLMLMLTATTLYSFLALPLKSKLIWWTLLFKELGHAWRVR